MMNRITQTVLVDLGYDIKSENKLINTSEVGRDDKQVKGYYSDETKVSYINEENIDNGNEGLVEVAGTEMQRAIDYKENTLSKNSSDEYRKGRASFSQNVGTNIKDYTNFALDYTNQGSISNITNVNTNNLVTSVPSVFNQSNTVTANNAELLV